MMTAALPLDQLQQLADEFSRKLGAKKSPRVRLTSSNACRFSILTSRILLSRTMLDQASPATRQYVVALMSVYARDGWLLSRILQASLFIGASACAAWASGILPFFIALPALLPAVSVTAGFRILNCEAHQILEALDADAEVAKLLGHQVALNSLQEYQALLKRDESDRACLYRLMCMRELVAQSHPAKLQGDFVPKGV